jgi:tetratricopeptide (TPR) repeat protein
VRNLAILVALGIGCDHGAQPVARFPDAPLQLGDDSDRDQAIDGIWAMPAGAARDIVRAQVADALFARITTALADDQLVVVESGTFELAALWQDDPQTVGGALAKHASTLRELRATFAKSGAIEPTLCVLVLLAEVESAHRADHVAEIDDILKFAAEAADDDTEIQHPAPAALLQPTVLALPLPWLVDRYIGVLEQQQRAIDEQFTKDKSFQIVGAATEVLQNGRRIASALARGHRAGEIAAHVAKLTGLGEDHQLLVRAEAVAQHPTADAYDELAKLLRAEDHQAPDQAAALAIALAGDAKFPHDSNLLTLAAESAAALGHVEQAIALYEAALAAQGGQVDAATALRLGKLYSQRIARLAFGGRPSAATTAWHDLTRYTDGAKQRAPHPVWQQVDAVAETALGRGLLSQGRLDEAEHALVASLDRAPSIDAYETLTTIYWKTDRLASASRSASAGLALLGDGSGDRYRRAKLERLSADVMRAAGKTRDANALYLDALRVWTTLGEDKNLPRTIAAERKLEFAHGMWYLGNTDRAVDLILEATDVAPDAPSICTEAVAFLLEVGKPIDALDAVHRGLSAPNLGELDKVYICLWVLADARRRGDEPDRQALDYLKSRHGDLWYELLAEAATNRLDFPALRAAANTSPRQAELAFYGVVLGLDPATKDPAIKKKTLERVVDAQLVMDAEYDLARQYLSAP